MCEFCDIYRKNMIQFLLGSLIIPLRIIIKIKNESLGFVYYKRDRRHCKPIVILRYS